MSFTVLVVLFAIVALGVLAFRKIEKKDESRATAPVQPPAVDTATAGIDYSRYAGVSPFELMTQPKYGRPDTLPGWDWAEWMKVNPGQPDPRVSTSGPAATRDTTGHVLARDGEWLAFDVGTKVFTLPGIEPGHELHLSISGANDAVLLILRDPYNQPVANRSFPAGAGELRYTCQASGTYTALVDARMAGTINSWRY